MVNHFCRKAEMTTVKEVQADIHHKVEEDMADAKAERDRYLSVVRPTLYRVFAAGMLTAYASVILFQKFT